MISSPITMLPPELMRDVISFAVGDPRELHVILRLSQVSQSFRQTVLDMSWLFTKADWNCWSTLLLDLWCQRARAQLLTVLLSPRTIHRLAIGEAPELKALLESYSQRWGTLIFAIQLERSDEDEIDFVERLLQRPCPLLHTIDGRASAKFAITLHLQPDCLPSLRTLRLCNILSVFFAPPTSVTELKHTCACPEHWSLLLDIVKDCRLIQRLTIASWEYHVNPITFPATSGKIVLPSLTLLELWGLVMNRVPAVSRFLSHCDIPKLKNLNIYFGWPTRPRVFKGLCQVLVSVDLVPPTHDLRPVNRHPTFPI